VTLPPFDLHRPQSLEEATEFADRYGEDAAYYCGGTELLLLLKMGFAQFGHLIDLKGIHELGGVRAENGSLVVGGTVTHRELERSKLVRERLPALAAMDELEGIGQPDGYHRKALHVQAATPRDDTVVLAQVYMKYAEQVIEADVQLGPLAEYTLAHAALYRRRGGQAY